MKSRVFIIGTLVVVAMLLLAGVAFVDTSHPVATQATMANQPASTDAMCADGAALQASGQAGIPSSCAEVHAQALAAGKLSPPQFERAELALASASTGAGSMTPEQCRAFLADLGYQCNERDLQACARRIQELGFCTEMTAEQCAAQLKKGLCTGDPAQCKVGQGGACCLRADSKTVEASGQGEAQVQAAVVTEIEPGVVKPGQCDWTKGSCDETATKK